MGTQIITIGKDGSVSGLQRKPGQGLDLTKFGRAKVERVSEIVFDEAHQQWFVQIITGPMAGRVLTYDLMREHAFNPHTLKHWAGWGSPDNRILFESYDHGVTAEVAFLDHCRLRGVH